jgi:hypothetical protein
VLVRREERNGAGSERICMLIGLRSIFSCWGACCCGVGCIDGTREYDGARGRVGSGFVGVVYGWAVAVDKRALLTVICCAVLSTGAGAGTTEKRVGGCTAGAVEGGAEVPAIGSDEKRRAVNDCEVRFTGARPGSEGRTGNGRKKGFTRGCSVRLLGRLDRFGNWPRVDSRRTCIVSTSASA